jgi:hypothetical protein
MEQAEASTRYPSCARRPDYLAAEKLDRNDEARIGLKGSLWAI